MITFFFHGFGSCGEAFQHYWPPVLDESERFFLDGHEHDVLTKQRRWFPFTSLADHIAKGIAGAADSAELQIREVIAGQRGGEDAPVALKGHSQGAMVALELARRRTLNVAVVHSYAGYLPPEIFDNAQRTDNRAVALDLYSSTADRFVDHAEVAQTAALFDSLAGFTVRHFRSSALTHDFSAAWLSRANFALVRN